MEPPLHIQLLGGLQVRRGAEVISRFRTRKMADLLAYLAYFRHRSHPREVLVELLWPEADLDSGRHNLSMALSFLRQLLEPPGVPDGSVLVTDRHFVGLNPAAVGTDVAEFEAALKDAAAAPAESAALFLTRAVESYGGELLPGHYDDWISPEQQRLDELYFQALRQLIETLEAAGALEEALQLALRAVAANRLREEAHRAVVRLYVAAGRPDAALRQYRELERILVEELGSTPGAEIQALVSQLRGSAAPQGRVPAPSPPPRKAADLPRPRSEQLEPVGGAVPLGSRFYVERGADGDFHAAMARRDSIVLVKGPRQVGKTSLLARGLQKAREGGARVVLTHFQTLSAADLETSETLLFALAETLAEQLEMETPPAVAWDPRRSPNLNFRRYMRTEVLRSPTAGGTPPLVWGIDEVDRIFSCTYGSDVFGLFRSWHDERALEPAGPWGRLTLAIAYSTEAHLFITDVNQSPFNVGTRLELEDFTADAVADLNRRYGTPLHGAEELERFHSLVGGHPYLVRRGLHQMVAQRTPLGVLESRAQSSDWIFGEHLRRILVLLTRDAELCEAAREVLERRPCPSDAAFYRLRSAGVLKGECAAEAQPRCRLYADFLKARLL